MLNKKAKWIWINTSPKSNEYAVFEDIFPFNGKKTIFRIAAETDYILYINGNLASFGQFAGYPFQKYYDEIDITPFCTEGKNTFTITVRYEGINSATHINDAAGVIFSAEVDGKLVAYSSKNTLGGYDNRYIQHTGNKISNQLGLSSGMCSGSYNADTPCIEIEKTYNIAKRPVKKTELKEIVQGKPLENKIYDLGAETAGYLYIKINLLNINVTKRLKKPPKYYTRKYTFLQENISNLTKFTV